MHRFGLADLISLSPLSVVEVTEARQIVELGIIPIAVERATDDDIAELREMVQEHVAALKRGEYNMPMSAAFHVRVAACTHDSAIEMLVHSFHGPLLMSLREAQVAAPLMGQRGTTEHREFVDALAARDTARAEEIMRAHLIRTARRVAKGRREPRPRGRLMATLVLLRHGESDGTRRTASPATSLLRRTRRTAQIALDAAGAGDVPVRVSWRLNERHYGALQGRNRVDVREQFGEELFTRWRRSFDARPPAPDGDAGHPDLDGDYADVPPRSGGASRCAT